MVMQYNKEGLTRLGDHDLAKMIESAHDAFRKRHPGMNDLPLPHLATPASDEASAVETRIVAQTSEPAFEIPTVSKELYAQTKEALAKEGYTFVVDIEPVSIGQLATGEETSQRFAYVNPSENMRAIVPPKMEVAINPENLRIKNSESKSTDTQIRMIQREETALKGKLSQEVRDLINMRMQNASVLAQLDGEYEKETGEVLFTNWFGRTDDQTIPGRVANVGRYNPTSRLLVRYWDRDLGYDVVFAVPVVVLPRQSAV